MLFVFSLNSCVGGFSLVGLGQSCCLNSNMRVASYIRCCDLGWVGSMHGFVLGCLMGLGLGWARCGLNAWA